MNPNSSNSQADEQTENSLPHEHQDSNAPATHDESGSKDRPVEKASVRGKLILAGILMLAFMSCGLIGYYHAQKKYTDQHYLFTLALSRMQMIEDEGKCYLVYYWNDGRKITFDVDEDKIYSHSNMQPVPVFAAEKHLLIPMNDEVTQALLAGGVIGSVKSAITKASRGGGGGKAKAVRIGIIIVGTVCGYFAGDVLYRKINPPEFSDEMIALLERKDAWNAVELVTLHNFARHHGNPSSLEIPNASIRSSDILTYVADGK